MKACSFFGHRDTPQTEELKQKVRETVERLIVEEGVDTFLFGSRSKFDELCLFVVSELKRVYPNIKWVYIRSQYLSIEKGYEEYLLQFYDDTIMPFRLNGAGRASYVERNQEMIDGSDYCVFYFDSTYLPRERRYSKNCLTEYQPKSGTWLAFNYACQKKRCGRLVEIINLRDE